ncbi:MAG TPA: PBP1A family penicillin-binding protein [Thermoanaerobaculia bacterium]|jgi:penicillin-binding protein 1A
MEYDPLPERNPTVNPTVNLYQQPPRPRPPRRSLAARIVRWGVVPLLTVLLAVAAGVVVGAVIKRPEVEKKLHDFEHRLVTGLYDADGVIFRTYRIENRILIEESEMPGLLKQAIIAAEDANFYRHGGIDLKGIIRAAYKNLRAGQTEEGASTITMMVAREIFLHRRREWMRKIEEAFLAVELEKRYSKEQILTLWANLQNLGHGNYGMEAAARDYFDKSVRDLTIAEAATLAGIPNRPSYLEIRTRPEAVRQRRDYVLRRMLEEEFISRQEYEAALAEPVLPVPKRRGRELGPYFAEEVRRYVYATYGKATLYDRGIQVFTTLDRKIQLAAEDAVRQGLLHLDHGKGWRGAKAHFEDDGLEERKLPSWTGQEVKPGEWYEGIVLESGSKVARAKVEGQVYDLRPEGMKWTGRTRPDRLLKRGDVSWFRFEAAAKEGAEPLLVVEQEPELEAAALVIETATGAVRAMIGGWDYNRNEFNRATQAQRQVGSAFKPFVYGAALENGFTAADTLFDGPAVFTGADSRASYSPRNYYRRYYGITTLRRALQGSYNVTSVKLLDLVGIDTVIDFAHRCGIRSELPPYPSLALGSADLVPLELAAAYAVFANKGIYVEPYFIERVTTRDGRPMQQHMPQAHQAMDPRHAYVMARMLKGVATNGTAAGGPYGLAAINLDVGGKTGTTDAYTDAWFVGFTPKYTLLTWVGYDKKRTIGRGMTGAVGALPIWTRLLRRGMEEGWIAEGETFARPPGIVERDIEYETGLLVGPGAARVYKEVFVEGNEPEKRFDRHWARIIELPWYLQEPYYLPKEGEKMPGQIHDWSAVREVWASKPSRVGG